MKFLSRKEICKTWPFDSEPPFDAWVSEKGHWTIQAFREHGPDGTPWEGTVRLGISKYAKGFKPNSEVEIHDRWTKIQDIKESLFPGRLAIEVFPAPSEVVDVAPMRWLWVLPLGATLPFSLSGESDLVGHKTN